MPHSTTYVTNINTTSSCPDYTPPAFVTGLNSNVVSETIISWRWTNPTDEDFNATILYLNGVNIADTANTFYNATGLTCDTLYNLTILTRDNNWNINTTGVTNINTTSVCPDITAPNIILESPIENHNISTNSINFNWTVTDNFDNSLSCNITLEGIVNISHVESINGTYTNYTISGFADGTYYWNVTCVDDSGNTNTSETRRFTIDTNKPTVNLNYPGQDYSTTQTLINFNWTVIDNIDSSLDCNLTIDSIVNISNVESVNGTYTNYTISGFADGTYYWNVTCVDDSGNTNTSETRRFTIDTTPPVVNLESPANNTLEQLTHTINFNYNTTDTTSNVENCSLYLNGTLYNTDYSITENTTQIFTESLNNGYYNWSISCIDSLGFTGNSSIRWLNISVAVPTITLVSPVNNYNSSSSNVTFNCSIVDDSGLINLTLYVWNNSDTYYINTTTITGTSNESSWMTESMPDGNYTWNCLAYDDSSLSDWGDENWTLIVNTVDSDGDGIPDLDDTLLGTVSNIQTTGVSNINVSINGSIANGSFAGKLDVVFWSGSNRLVSFLHNFSESNLNLSKVSMQLTSTYFIVNLGNQLQTGITKSMYLDDDSFSSFCVKDAEISSISEMSSACNGANETNFTICLGNNSGVQLNGLNCTDEGNRIRVDNLTYSAIRGTQASAGISSLGGSRSARYNMNLYVIKECTDKPITLIIKSLDNKSIFLAEVSIFKGNNTDINNRIIHHYLMRENALKFTDSLETTFNLTEQGYYTLLVRNTGYQDVKYGFDLKECVKEIKIELEPEETSLLDKKTEEKGKDIKSSLEKEKTVIKSKKITTISIIIIITALFIYFLIHRSRNKENKVKEIF